MKTITTKELLASYIANMDKTDLNARIAALFSEELLLQLANPVVIKINKILPNFIELFRKELGKGPKCTLIKDVRLIYGARVEVTYEASVTRYFRTEEAAKRACSRYDGNGSEDEDYPYAAEVTYTSNTPIALDRVIDGLEVEYI